MTDEPRLPWLSVTHGDAPLIVTMPHTGVDIPQDIESALISPWLARASKTLVVHTSKNEPTPLWYV